MRQVRRVEEPSGVFMNRIAPSGETGTHLGFCLSCGVDCVCSQSHVGLSLCVKQPRPRTRASASQVQSSEQTAGVKKKST